MTDFAAFHIPKKSDFRLLAEDMEGRVGGEKGIPWYCTEKYCTGIALKCIALKCIALRAQSVAQNAVGFLSSSNIRGQVIY